MKIQITPSLRQFWIDPGHLRSFKVIGGHFLARLHAKDCIATLLDLGQEP